MNSPSAVVEISDSVIPKDLCGRGNEFRNLLHAYETSVCATTPNDPQELVLIQGKSGTGKSFLASSMIARVKQDSGFFLVGKFELTTTQDPFAVFVSLFDQFIDELFGKVEKEEARIAAIREAVQLAIGKEGKVLTDMIPSLERLLEQHDDTCDVQGKEALNRFHFVFCKFCRAVSTIAPLFLFLDDLQWGDSASLDLLVTLLQSKGLVQDSSLLVIGAFRDEEISDHSDFTPTILPELTLSHHLAQIDNLVSSGSLNLTSISLQNLDEASTNEMLGRYLTLSTDATHSLGVILHDNCQGNPFHAMQLLRLLISKGHVHRDPERKWTWNDQDIIEAVSSFQTIDELVREKLDHLPQFTQKVLHHAACMGDEIDVPGLAIVMDGSTVPDLESSVQGAASGGHLIFDRESRRFRFAHDRIRQTVLSMVDDTNSMSFQIGYKLWTRSSPFFLSTKMFLVTSLLNHGTDKITDQEERYKAAALNLEAAIKATSQAAFPDACRYARAGIEFLEGGDYWKEQYKLTLSLFNIALDAEVCDQNFSRVTELSLIVFDHARSVKDTVPAHIARINSLGQLGQVREAMEVGLDVVRQLGETVPESSLAALKTRLALRFSSNESLLRLPPMDNEEKMAAMHVLAILLPYAFFAGSKFPPIVGVKLARLCLLYGIHKYSSLGFAAYGWVLCGKDCSEGHRLGKLAMTIVEKYRARELIPHVHIIFYGLINHWKRPLNESVESLATVEKISMELGDVEHALFALRFKCNHGFWCGMNLLQIEGLLVEGLGQMKRFKQLNAYHITTPFLQYIHNLTGRAPDPKILSGQIVNLYNPSERVESMSVPNVHYIFGMDLAYLFGDYELAQEIMERRHNLNFEPYGTYPFAASRFKEALISIASVRRFKHKRKYLKIARRNLKQMKQWAGECPENFLHKQRLIEAELLSLKPSNTVNSRTQAAYDESIQRAVLEGFVQEAALACELCGSYMNQQSKSNLAVRYWEEACRLHAEWGATEKVAHLARRVRQLSPTIE